MADKLMYIPNDDTQNCRLKLVVETFKHLTYYTNQSQFTQVPKVVNPTNKKTLLYNFGDQCNKQPIVPSLPERTGQSTDPCKF